MTLRTRLLVCCLAAMGAVLVAMQANAIEKVPWTVKGDFHGKKARQNISGIICPENTVDWCITVNDDKNYIQFFSHEKGMINPGKRMLLLPDKVGGEKMKEIDAEGVAYENGFVYVTGSHGLARKTNKLQPSRFFVFRFPVEHYSGKPSFDISHKNVADEIERSDVLGPLLEQDANLGTYAKTSLKENGLNIEGLAAVGDALYFGLRAPNIDGDAFILSVATTCIFKHQDCMPKLYRIALGAGDGIRDLTGYGTSILILSGPGSCSDEGAAAIWQWSPTADLPRRLAGIPQSEGHKAEGIMVLPDGGGNALNLLVVYDGETNGAPEEIVIPFK